MLIILLICLKTGLTFPASFSIRCTGCVFREICILQPHSLSLSTIYLSKKRVAALKLAAKMVCEKGGRRGDREGWEEREGERERKREREDGKWPRRIAADATTGASRKCGKTGSKSPWAAFTKFFLNLPQNVRRIIVSLLR
jgi:hypothetical protein